MGKERNPELDKVISGLSHLAEKDSLYLAAETAPQTYEDIRHDGFWNVSLHDPDNFGGKELTVTSLFVYGMAWGVRNGILGTHGSCVLFFHSRVTFPQYEASIECNQ